jgi:phospholipid transport system substrate-binding protein
MIVGNDLFYRQRRYASRQTQLRDKQMKSLKKTALTWALVLTLPGLVYGQALSAVQTAELGVEALLQSVSQTKHLFLSDRDQYFSEIEQVLSSFVDFNAVATVVMSRYASAATVEQTQHFADILKTTLTRFYGAALVSYNGEGLVFLPPGNPATDPRADTVVGMELQGDTNLSLQYQMFLNDNDEWKLKNISLAGINLGRQYFTQFSALMSQHDNDINSVLDNWK